MRLRKWAKRQDENFLTDSFAHLLQHLLDEEPIFALGLLDSLTGGFLRLKIDEAKTVVVRTQIITGSGTPDIELRTSRHRVFIEVKSEASATSAQVERYLEILRNGDGASTCLVLLTRYTVRLPIGSAAPNFFARYSLADWMEQHRSQYVFKPVSAYLRDQFLGFLSMRNMTMGQVTWDLGNGVRALRNFVDMLHEAACACGLKAKRSASTDVSGVSLADGKYWVGIYFNDPDSLVFSTEKQAVRKEAATELGVGEVHDWTDKIHFGWSRWLDLRAEDTHFYARSRASQMQFVEEFIRESIELSKRVEITVEGAVGNVPAADDA